MFLCQGKGEQLPANRGSGRLRRNLCHCKLLPVLPQWHKSFCASTGTFQGPSRGVQVLPMAGTKTQQLQGWNVCHCYCPEGPKHARDSGQCQPSHKSPAYLLCLAGYQSSNSKLFILNHVYFISFCRIGQFSLIFGVSLCFLCTSAAQIMMELSPIWCSKLS